MIGGDEPGMFQQLCGGDLQAAILPRKKEQLEREIQSRDERILSLEREIAALKFQLGGESSIAASVLEVMGRLVAVTNRIFPGPLEIDYGFDPDDPKDRWLCFHVVARGEYAEYRHLKSEWYDEVAKLIPGTLCEFRLSVMPQR